MFDLPDAKRIRRSDLFTHSPSSRSPSPSKFSAESPDPTLQQTLHSRLAALYGPITTSAPFHNSNGNGNSAPKDIPTSSADDIQDNDLEPVEEEQEQEQGYEFRLFSTPYNNNEIGETHKIVLQDEDDEDVTGPGRFITRERDKRYYIAEKAKGERKAAYQFAALSSNQVLHMSSSRNWGLEVPWRVKILRVSGSTSMSKSRHKDQKSKPVDGDHAASGTIQLLVDVDTSREQESRGKTKPGKKRRILLREKRRKKESIEAEKKAEQERREEAEREKRTRRNREKKVKKKMKEKAKKSSTIGAEEGSGSD